MCPSSACRLRCGRTVHSSDNALRIGVDLGGTKIEAVALDDDGIERTRRRVATPADDYEATLATIRDLVLACERDVGTRATAGIGMPGSISPTTALVRNANSTWLNGRRFVEDVSASLRRDVRVENDANCFALSEAVRGAGAGHRMVFGVILGTGVGGGIVLDGRIWTGRNAIAGEWGHNRLPSIDDDDRPVPRCWCGRDGCIETYLSGPALAADHARRHGGTRDARAIVAAASAGDAAARETMNRYVGRLAKALASVVNVLDPDVVVLGGGLSNVDLLYDALPPMLATRVFSDTVTTPVVRNRHGDASGVRGAAWLWPAS